MFEDRYYLRFKGRVLGPLTKEQTLEMVKRGQITRQHELSPDSSTWSLAENYEELFSTDRGHTFALGAESKPTTNQPSKGNAIEWFAHFDGANQGPVDAESLRAWISKGKVTTETMIWKAGMSSWLEAELVCPEWFPNKLSRLVRAANETVRETVSEVDATDRWNDETASAIANIVLKPRGWMLTLGIAGVISCIIGLFVTTFWFVSEVSTPGLGPSQATRAIAAVIVIMSAAIFLYINTLLIRVASNFHTIHEQPTTTALREAFFAYNRFWFTLTTFVLAWLVVVLLFLVIVAISGVDVVSAGSPTE